MKKALGLFLAGLIGYFLLWPIDIDPQAWKAPKNQGYQGDFVVNQRLAGFERIELDGLHGPEAITQDTQGTLYASTHEGWIVRWNKGDQVTQKWGNVGGRPLGLAFGPNGDLWVANAYLGLMRITPDGDVTIPVTETNGVKVRYADDVVVASNGKVYFSDATTKFSASDVGDTLAASLLDLMEHGLHGRIIEYDSVTEQSREILTGLSFANGVTIDPQESFLLIVETGEYRVIKYWLSGPKLGSQEVLIGNLPGFPDNIHVGLNGNYWIGLTAPRSEVLDKLSNQPFLRKVIQRLPAFMRPNVAPYGMVIAIDGQGNVMENLQDPSGQVYASTGAYESEDFLYVSSLTADFITRYKRSQFDTVEPQNVSK